MKPLAPFSFTVLALALAACVHTPPGTSVNVALAKRAELVRSVAPPLPPPGSLPVIEPELPGNSTVELVAEAIAAFEEAAKIDPGFTEAWQHLAILYAKIGQEKKALEAFRRARKLAQQ